jgi:cyclic beta-1,2-glucan synthetase
VDSASTRGSAAAAQHCARNDNRKYGHEKRGQRQRQPLPDYVENGGACAHRITKVPRDPRNGNGRVREGTGASGPEPTPPFAPRPLLYSPALRAAFLLRSSITTLRPTRFFDRVLQSRSDAREALLTGPIRGELLGAERLGERAQEVAASQRLATGRRARRLTPLLARLNGTRRILEEANARLTASDVAEAGDVGPAGEWLLDNYHVVQEHIGEVRESLPRGYYRELPELSGGPLAGYPRVYELAITLISHTEGRVDLDNVTGFVAAFQEVSPLTIGELWAVPAMLRLGLIENVRRMALRTVNRLDELELADAAAARIAAAADEGQRALDAELDKFASDPPSLTPDFVSRFLHQLRV